MVLGFADEMKKLSDDIISSYNLRIGTVKDIMRNTHSLMNNFHHQRQDMSQEMRSDLTKFVRQLRGDVKKMLSETHHMLENFKNEFADMSKKLHSMLSGYYKDEIQKSVHDTLAKYRSEMKEFANEFQTAHQAWMKLSGSMAAARKGQTKVEAITPAAGAGKKRKYSRRSK